MDNQPPLSQVPQSSFVKKIVTIVGIIAIVGVASFFLTTGANSGLKGSFLPSNNRSNVVKQQENIQIETTRQKTPIIDPIQFATPIFTTPTITNLSVKEGIINQLIKLDITGTNLDTVTTLRLGGVIAGMAMTKTTTTAHFEFYINQNIAIGEQNLTVTNSSGTSAAVKFTVKAASANYLGVPLLSLKPMYLTLGTYNLPVAQKYGLDFNAEDSNSKSQSYLMDDKGNLYLNYKWTLKKGDTTVWASGWTDTFPEKYLSKTCIVNVNIPGGSKGDVWTCANGKIPSSALENITAGTYTFIGEVGDGKNGSATSKNFEIKNLN